jgi:hypothetical protein
MASPWESPARYWPWQPNQWKQRTSSQSCASTWSASDQFVRRATPPKSHYYTRTSTTACTSFYVRTQHAGFWSYLIAALIKSSREEETLQLLVCGKPLRRFYRKGEASLHIERDRLREHHFQLLGQHNPSHSTTAPLTTPPPPATQTTCSGRLIRFPARFNT